MPWKKKSEISQLIVGMFCLLTNLLDQEMQVVHCDQDIEFRKYINFASLIRRYTGTEWAFGEIKQIYTGRRKMFIGSCQLVYWILELCNDECNIYGQPNRIETWKTLEDSI